ncbi:tRNA dihydrouridine synthase [Spirochaeta africana]|nr:tRNA-dihydrouridine synthase [Spirochaeta africana]
MEDVTDRVFRGLIADLAPPDLFFTEFIAAQALAARRRTTMAALPFSEPERPIAAQIWGIEPEQFYQAAVLLSEHGYDAIDINMGCPARKIIKKGACAGLIGNLSLTSELIHATREGAAGRLPISVKTRIGIEQPVTEEWCGFLLEQNLDALTLHPRTAVQMSEGTADWQHVRTCVAIRDSMGSSTVIIGNGDVQSLSHGRRLSQETGADGIMIGRGIFANPYFFDESRTPLRDCSRATKLSLAREHTRRFQAAYGSSRNFEILKKFYKCYIVDFPGWEDDFRELMQTHSYAEAYQLLDFWLESPEIS